MNLMTREEAIAAGFKKYYTGVPCRNGHTTPRYTTTRMCLGCLKDAAIKNKRKVTAAYVARLQGFVKHTITIKPEHVPVIDTIVSQLANYSSHTPDGHDTGMRPLLTFVHYSEIPDATL